MRHAAGGDKVDLSGKFYRRCKTEEFEIYLYEFTSTVQACSAKFSDFTVTRVPVKNDEILSPLTTTAMVIDLRLITLTEVSSYVTDNLKSPLRDVMQKAKAATSQTNVVEDLEAIINTVDHLESNLIQSCPNLGEVTDNNLICEKVSSIWAILSPQTEVNLILQA